MGKYIDAEKLIAEIERRLKIVEPHKDTFESAAACRQELIWMKDFITSLQQEQTEVDLEKEIKDIYSRDLSTLKTQYARLARHLYELGLKARKEG